MTVVLCVLSAVLLLNNLESCNLALLPLISARELFSHSEALWFQSVFSLHGKKDYKKPQTTK